VTANPYGLDLPLHVAGLGLGGVSKASLYAAGLHTFEGQVVMALVFWTLLTVAISPATREPAELAAIAPLAVVAYASPAELPFFAVAAAPVLARHVEALLPPHVVIPVALSSARRGVHAVALGTCGIVFALGFKGTPASSAAEALSPTNHPVEAVAFLNAQPALGRLFNHADWGGYLIDHLYPHYQVSMDGRRGLYDDAIRSAYLETERAGPAWRQFFDDCKPDVVLWRRHHALITELESLPGWERLYEDSVAVIFVADTAHPLRPGPMRTTGRSTNDPMSDLDDSAEADVSPSDLGSS
jgi:hypothetical protein